MSKDEIFERQRRRAMRRFGIGREIAAIWCMAGILAVAAFVAGLSVGMLSAERAARASGGFDFAADCAAVEGDFR